jgi:hypothetical protein
MPPGLTPLPPDPLAGLGPLPSDALANLPPSNPFAATVGGYIAPQPKPRFRIDDTGRRGLAWERYPSTDAFTDTVGLVVSAPQEAFESMRRRGGVGNPLGFFIVSSVVAEFLLLIELLVGLVGYFLLIQWGIIDLGRGPVQIQWEPFFLWFGSFALAGIVGTLVGAMIGGFIWALFFHLCLMAAGGANAGFEATYRVVAFGCGSVYMLMPIPLVGPLFFLVMQPVVLFYGFLYAHETSGARALAAVVLPILMAVCCLGLSVLLFVPAAASFWIPAGR